MNRPRMAGVAALAIAVPLFCFAQQPPAPTSADSYRRMDSHARQIANDIRESRRLLLNMPDTPTRENIDLLLSRAELHATDLQRELDRGGGGNTRLRRGQMSPEEFTDLYERARQESFDSRRSDFLIGALRDRFITGDQGARL